MLEGYVRGCCVYCHSLFFLICRTFEESMQPKLLYLLFGILGNLSMMFFIKLPASDEKEVKSDLRDFDVYLANLRSVLNKLPDIPAQKHPYLMKFEESFALSYQKKAFLLLRLAYCQILNLNEMLQLATVCLSISFSITPLTSSEEGVEMLTHAANCRMCVIG